MRTKFIKLAAIAFICTAAARVSQAYNLSPISFENLYRIAADGDLQGLKDVQRRGLNLDSPNMDGDTAVCVAIKRQDYLAYKTLIRAGAKSNPDCVERLPEYAHKNFLANYNQKYAAPQTPTNWAKSGTAFVVGGGIAAGIVALASSGGGGGSSKSGSSHADDESNTANCDLNPCAEGCYENITCAAGYQCTQYESKCNLGCTKCEQKPECVNVPECTKGCYTNLTCQSGYKCSKYNKCNGCEKCEKAPEETPDSSNSRYCKDFNSAKNYCNACNDGYTSVNGVCRLNAPEHCADYSFASEKCSACEAGYKLESDKRTCTVDNGNSGDSGGSTACTAANYPLTVKPDADKANYTSCKNNGTTRYKITSCKSGYAFASDGKSCVAKTPVENCQHYSTLNDECIQCNAGYTLSDDKKTCEKTTELCVSVPDDALISSTEDFECDISTQWVEIYCDLGRNYLNSYYYKCQTRQNTEGCTGFEKKADMCTDCQADYILLNGSCIKQNQNVQANNDDITVDAEIGEDTNGYKCENCGEDGGIFANGYNQSASITINMPETWGWNTSVTGMLNDTNCDIANSYYDNNTETPQQSIIELPNIDDNYGHLFSDGGYRFSGVGIKNTGTGKVYNSFFGNGLINNFSTGISSESGTIYNAHGGTGIINAFETGIIINKGNVINASNGGSGTITVEGKSASDGIIFSSSTSDISQDYYLFNAYDENSKGKITVINSTGRVSGGISSNTALTINVNKSDKKVYAYNAFGNGATGIIKVDGNSYTTYGGGISASVAINAANGGIGIIEVNGDLAYGLYGSYMAANSYGNGQGTITMRGKYVTGIANNNTEEYTAYKIVANGTKDEINIHGVGTGLYSYQNTNYGNINVYHNATQSSDDDNSYLKYKGFGSYGIDGGYNSGNIYMEATAPGYIVGIGATHLYATTGNNGNINIISSSNNNIYGMAMDSPYNYGKINITTTAAATSTIYGMRDTIPEISHIYQSSYQINTYKNSEININVGGKANAVYGLASSHFYLESKGDNNGWTFINNEGNILIRSTSGTKLSNVYGIYGDYATIKNSGNITLSNVDESSSYGIYAVNGSKVYNSGTITINGESYSKNEADGKFIYIDASSSMVNDGEITVNTAFDVSSLGNGKFILGKNGKITAEEIKGNITADADITSGGFDKTYYNKDAFSGKTDEIKLASGSALFDAVIKGSDIVMTMKDFDEVVQDKSVADYLQQNYEAQRNAKFFDALKLYSSAQSLNRSLNQQLGFSLLPNFAQENMNVFRSLSNLVTDTMFSQDLTNERMMVGYDYLGQNRSGKGRVTGYENTANSSYFLADAKLNNRQRFGLGVALTRFNSDYDDDSSRKATLAQALGSYMHDFGNRWKYAGLLRAGYADGDYKRQSGGTRIGGDTSDILYGFNNELRYSYDLGVAVLEPQFELNASGYYQRKIKEDDAKTNALQIKGTNNLSLESGAGLYLSKEAVYGENGRLKGRLGGSYYRELSQPYHTMRARVNDTEGYYLIESSDIFDRNRTILRADVAFSYKAWEFYLRGSRFMEDRHTTVINAGIKYNF